MSGPRPFLVGMDSAPPKHGGALAHADALAWVCPLPIVAVSLDGRVTAWNPAAERVFGWSVAEVLGQPLPIIEPGSWPELLARLLALTATGGYGEQEAERLHKDGSIVEVSMTSAQVKDADGHIVGICGIYQDVGARNRRDALQRAQLGLLQAIVDGIPSPVFYKDPEGAYLGCNTAFMAYVGKPREEIVGKTVYDAWSKELADIYAAADRRLIASGGTQIYEASVNYADGTLHDVVFHKGVFWGDDGEVGGQVGTILDITDRKRAESALRESEERYRAVISALQEGILLKDRSGATLTHNTAAERILGILGTTLSSHIGLDFPIPTVDEAGDAVPSSRLPIAQTLADGVPRSDVVVEVVRPDGAHAWLSMNTRPLFASGEGAPNAVVLSFSDITERKLSQERLARHAYFDALTNLPNRVLFQRKIDEQIRSASRGAGRFAVLYMDLDGFKRVNDTLGHGAGDALLQTVAARFNGCIRDADTVARIGGDEFTLILADVREPAQVAIVASRILDAVAEPIVVGGQEVVVGVSIGCAMFPDDGNSAEGLMRCADEAMYQAKQAGKNRLAFHAAAPNSKVSDRLALEGELRHGIDRGELELHCQPKLLVATGELTGFEVLVRWRHPTRGLLPPGAFLPIAEEGGLIVPLTAWVLERACEQSVEWLRAGYAAPRVAVNVSAKQVDDHALVSLVTRVLEKTGLPASYLELEVTEDAIMSNAHESARGLSRLRELGVTVAVDDFGTGYSSLSYLQKLPIDTLKIDRSFIQSVHEPTRSRDSAPPSSRSGSPGSSGGTRPIVQAIISMARALCLDVVAEGVETDEQLAVLRELGCDQVQGYLLGRPMPAAEFAEKYLPRPETPAVVVGAGFDPHPTVLAPMYGPPGERVRRTSSLLPPPPPR